MGSNKIGILSHFIAPGNRLNTEYVWESQCVYMAAALEKNEAQAAPRASGSNISGETENNHHQFKLRKRLVL